MHDGTTRLDKHKITAAAGLNLPATEAELYNGRAFCSLHMHDWLHDEHKITAGLNLPATKLQDTNSQLQLG